MVIHVLMSGGMKEWEHHSKAILKLPQKNNSTGHKIVFTHGDLAPRNIMISKDFVITGIIDWEYGGWYPEYWEYVKAKVSFTVLRYGPSCVSIYLDPYPQEDHVDCLIDDCL